MSAVSLLNLPTPPDLFSDENIKNLVKRRHYMSDFINAPEHYKAEVFDKVITRAIARQNEILKDPDLPPAA